MLHVLPISLLNLITLTGEGNKLWSSSLCNFFHLPITSSILDTNILLSTLFSNTMYALHLGQVTKFHTHIKNRWNYILIFKFFDRRWEDKHSKLNCNKHSLDKKLLCSYETSRFITMFKEPAIRSYPELDESSLHHHTLFL